MPDIYNFERFTLDLRSGCLKADDREIALRPKSFALLRYLVENADRLVGKDELLKAVWPDVFVTDDSLKRCISEVRLALGDHEQKIIKTTPRRGFRFTGPVSQATTASRPSVAPTQSQPHHSPEWSSVPDGPSIAVLPFQNLSGDPGQDYFADGVVEEIITALSRMRWLFVIARNSSFIYKGRTVDVRQIGRELGVRYLLEGSIRRAASRVRVTAQLIDVATAAHIWADRFDGALEDIFDLQDEVTSSVVGALAPKLEQAEIERTRLKPTENLTAYDHFLRGMASTHDVTKAGMSNALDCFYRAIECDPKFASALGMAAWCHTALKAAGWTADPAQGTAEGYRLGWRAAEYGADDAVALVRGGYAIAFMGFDFEKGHALIERAIRLNPNLAAAWTYGGWIKVFLGDFDRALEYFARTQRLNPLDPLSYRMMTGAACAHYFAGRYDEASSWAEKALLEQPNFLPATRVAAASHALAGRLEEAQQAMARLRQLDPDLRISNLWDRIPFRRPQDVARYEEGLRKAGLPE